MSNGRTFTDPITVRIKPAVREAVRVIAERDGDTETAVLRRLIAAGLRSEKIVSGAAA